MVIDLGLLILGGAMLYFGAEWLVHGAAGIARALGISPLAIGLTVVAYGTSAPELAVSLLAAIEGKGDIAIGNVIGSNIANIGLILGLTALIAPPKVESSLMKKEIPVFIAAVGALILVLMNGVISRFEGALLLVGAFGFTWLALRTVKQMPKEGEITHEIEDEVARETGKGSRLKLSLVALAGLATLLLGGKFFVDGAVGIALAFGMSERVVGLTVVAVGTSLPELAASLVAAFKGHSAMAIGNVIGSNIFNILLILGASSLVVPIPGDLLGQPVELAVLIGLTLLCALLLRTERVVSRIEGGVLLSAYFGFLALLAFAS